ncbi:S8 family serine peptidase [Pelomonas sp. P7]|uniref:S8 family serine peptidase n=1 Tax=Pelomonas caseinilytica TaxID=2906763 RepID=A0ABS8XD23_9BURK|nr:S8 family serine peptidase [Pelomonas sp. P7]MCE4538817.1 S8 family serine peptidase [Pelomonas sp. P7]
MLTTAFFVAAMAAMAAVLATPLPVRALASAEPEARVIVRFKPGADSVRAKALSLRATRAEAREVAQTRATALGLRTGQALAAGRSLDERTHVVMSRGMTAAQLAQRLAADPEVELVAVDRLRKHFKLPDDPLFGGANVNPETTVGGIQTRVIDQWYLKAPGTVTNPAVVSSINAPAAWDLTTGSGSVVVAVIDTGVRSDHPDLAGKFLPPALVGQIFAGYDMVGFSSNGTSQQANSITMANDGDGADVDASDPGDWITFAENNTAGGQFYHCEPADDGSYPQIDSSWHGTRVSGLIAAASNNTTGMAGVGWGLKLLPVRVLGKCGGYDSDIIAGVKWAAGIAVPGLPTNTNKAKVLNLSLGGSGSCASTDSTGSLYRDAIGQVNATGATIVVAAGNSKGLAVGLPGNCPGVITVTALRHVGTKVGFASIGPEVTVAAPGGNCINVGAGQPCLYPMVSTTNSGATTPVVGDASYTGSSASVGTSFSAPIVSGVVGLMASVRPALTSAESTAILKVTARAFPTTGGTAGTPVCRAPDSTEQAECYCKTGICGAGMVDAAGAVAAARTLNDATVTVTPSSATLTATQSATLTAAISGLAAGKTVTATHWTLLDGGSNPAVLSALGSGADTSTVTVVPAAAGSFKVQADLTDSDGYVHSQTATITVAAAPVQPTSSSGGGGGGAAGAAWLAGLLVAALALRRSARGG